jgi:hypothetical protein
MSHRESYPTLAYVLLNDLKNGEEWVRGSKAAGLYLAGSALF